MDLERLVLLKGDDEAQRIIVTWPDVAQNLITVGDVEGPNYDDWAALADVDPSLIVPIANRMFRLRFIGPDGYIDDAVVQFIQTQLAGSLPRVRRT